TLATVSLWPRCPATTAARASASAPRRSGSYPTSTLEPIMATARRIRYGTGRRRPSERARQRPGRVRRDDCTRGALQDLLALVDPADRGHVAGPLDEPADRLYLRPHRAGREVLGPQLVRRGVGDLL